MGHILNKAKGSSMLLAICIFLILTVLGINVMAASQSNVQNMNEKYETEQAMQYVNSIYEIIDKNIRNGEFKLDGYLTSAGADDTASEANLLTETNKQTLQTGDKKETITTYIEFYRTVSLKELKAKVYVIYHKTTYSIVSRYKYTDDGKYKLQMCEGVVSSEEE